MYKYVPATTIQEGRRGVESKPSKQMWVSEASGKPDIEDPLSTNQSKQSTPLGGLPLPLAYLTQEEPPGK